MIVLREIIGRELRRLRRDQGRTLREVSDAAQVSLGYLSEVERGQKEASSELLAAICGALSAPLSQVLAAASDDAAVVERVELGRRPVHVSPGVVRSAHILAA
ncbi:helix-turn-helix domain-containing protein [Candidatus Nanopelagicales bacterium]|nr:helix-turn-helix domain-containing protein [Candidatus Nanopelagicales bacterium]